MIPASLQVQNRIPASPSVADDARVGRAVALVIQGDDNYGVGRVAREIASLVPEIRCVAFNGGSEAEEIAATGVRVHVLASGEYFRGFAPRPGFAGALRQMVEALPRARRCAAELDTWCRREGVQILHGNVWAHYLTLGALRRARSGAYCTIWHVHNFLNTQRHFGLPARFNWWQTRRGADWLLCVSHSVAEGWGRSGVPVRVIHNCAPARRAGTEPTARPHAVAGPLRLVVAGRMEWCKGHHVAIAAVQRLRDRGVAATLDVFGGPVRDNPYCEQLRQQVTAANLQDRVTLRGFVDDLAARLPQYDVALQCRIDPEPCSIYVLECLAAGIPLVASANGGTPELMQDRQDGCLYPPGDDSVLADRLAWLERSPTTREQLGRTARERARTEFSRPRFAARLREFYADVLAQAGGGRVR